MKNSQITTVYRNRIFNCKKAKSTFLHLLLIVYTVIKILSKYFFQNFPSKILEQKSARPQKPRPGIFGRGNFLIQFYNRIAENTLGDQTIRIGVVGTRSQEGFGTVGGRKHGSKMQRAERIAAGERNDDLQLSPQSNTPLS